MSQVAKEVAEQEFERFTSSMDLDVEKEHMDADDRKSFDEARRIVVKAIERGQLVVDDRGQPIFTPSAEGATPITFYEPTGASFMAMDGQKKTHDMARMHLLLADMTRTPAKTFALMANRDLKICRTLVTLFLG